MLAGECLQARDAFLATSLSLVQRVLHLSKKRAQPTTAPTPLSSAAASRAQADESAQLQAALLADADGLRAADGASVRTLQASVEDWSELNVLYLAKQEQAGPFDEPHLRAHVDQLVDEHSHAGQARLSYSLVFLPKTEVVNYDHHHGLLCSI